MGAPTPKTDALRKMREQRAAEREAAAKTASKPRPAAAAEPEKAPVKPRGKKKAA